MGISNPEIQKKVFGPRWEHEIEKQGWPFWKRLMHRHASPNHKVENFNERYRLITIIKAAVRSYDLFAYCFLGEGAKERDTRKAEFTFSAL